MKAGDNSFRGAFMGVICVGVPWGGGAFVSIPSKSISRDGRESRAVLHAKSQADTDVRSLGHRAIEWIAGAKEGMRSRFAEFRERCFMLNVFVNARLVEMKGVPEQYRGGLSKPFSLLEAAHRQGKPMGMHVSQVKYEIGEYIKKNEGLKIGTKDYSVRQRQIFIDMVHFLQGKYTLPKILK
jgi:hypothetical protein